MQVASPKAEALTAARPAVSPPSSRRPSGRARPEIVCKWEKFSLIVREIGALVQRQFAEVGVEREAIPLDPDWSRYFEYERAGILHIWGARANGVLVGYVVCFVCPGMHHMSTLHAYADLFWLAPEWRDGSTGWRFLKSVEKPLKALGVKVLRFNTNDTHRPDAQGRSMVSALLVRNGFSRVETVHQKVL